MSTPTPPTPTCRIARSELALVAVLFLTGTALRCAHPAHMAVEHFDEGVYASDIWFGPEAGNHYPAQHLFAPPLLPESIFWTFVLGGTSNFNAMLPSLVAGCLTILLVWWVARSWFGPAAGLAAATLCALSDPHIAFSRTALTDVPLCFWLLAAVYCLWLASTRGSYVWAVAAGLLTGLAWWTKYNGWLPLAIGAAGFAAFRVTTWGRSRGGWTVEGGGWRVEGGRVGGLMTGALQCEGGSSAKHSLSFAPPTPSPSNPPTLPPPHPPTSAPSHPPPSTLPPPPSHPPPRTLGLLATTALVACAVWSPWLVVLQDKGGYAAVAANHRGYVVGWQGWLASAVQQFDNLSFLEGTASAHALALAIVAVGIYSTCEARRFTWNVPGSTVASVAAPTSQAALWALGAATLALAASIAAPAGVQAAVGVFGLVSTLTFASRSTSPLPEAKGERCAGVGAAFFEGAWSARVLAAWLLAAWFCGLALTTPLYSPYPRLVLPWLMSTWLAAATAVYAIDHILRPPSHSPPLQGGVQGGRAAKSPGARAVAPSPQHDRPVTRTRVIVTRRVRDVLFRFVSRFAKTPASGGVNPRRLRGRRTLSDGSRSSLRPMSEHSVSRTLTRLALFAMLLAIVALETLVVPRGVPAWKPRDRLAAVAAGMSANVRQAVIAGPSSPTDFVIYTYGEPALLFQLRLAGVENVYPVVSLPGAEPQPAATPVGIFVAFGEQARRTAGFDAQFAAARDHLELVARYVYAPSDIVLLDNRNPRDRPPANSAEARPSYAIELYRVQARP